MLMITMITNIDQREMQYNMKRIDNDAVVTVASRFCGFATFGQPSLGLKWWFRVADFPRNQLIFSGWWRSLAYFWLGAFDSRWQMGLILLLLIALAMQAYMVLPFIRFCGRNKCKRQSQNHAIIKLKLLVANVLTTNPNKQALIDLIHTINPILY